ncbi:restriction endonuclease subunit S [Deinococcus caeni]|uniref:Restriction endonuclease subunit S n=1 Tax=Deinococcus caeni TaxID=569127 RepID=A0ABP9UG58_9DEIO
MIHDLKPYPAMKDSGVPWLGQVPEHWEVRSLGSLTKARSERNRPDLPLLSVVREKGVILRDRESKGENHNFIPDDLSNYKVVREGDLVVNKMKAWQGSMGLAPVDGIVSPAYFVFDFDIQNRKYGQALLRSSTYVGFFAQASDGVRIGQWDLSIDGMKRIPVVIPEPDEQAAIVRFLEHADRRIRKAIAAKQKLIKLLQEQKQVIIHQAVTRGLDPNVKLKPSGVEWLGDVPEEWEVTSFTRCTIERADYRGATPTKTESGVFLVTAKNVRRGWIDYEASQEYIAESDYAVVMRRGMPKIGDLLFTTEAPLGHVALVDREDVAFAQRVIRFRFDLDRCEPGFVLQAVLSPYFQHQVLSRGTGSTALGIKASKLPELILVLPSVEEQAQILAYIRDQTVPLE